jgi:nucleoid-associated protein YgaU
LVEVREVVPEDQAPSPSLAAFNKSFGMSHRGKLLSVGFETTSARSKMSKILTLWKSPVIVAETGGESSEQPEGVAQDSEKEPHPSPEATPLSRGKASSGSAKQVTMQHFSKQGSFLFFITFLCFF